MAPESSATAWNVLRSVTQRLTSTPKAQLHQIVPFLASTISSCKSVLVEIDHQSSKSHGSDLAATIHKLKTQIAALLKDDNAGARWTAVVLVKALIEIGGPNLLQDSGSWTRALLGYLSVGFSRSNLPSIKILQTFSTETGDIDNQETKHHHFDTDLPSDPSSKDGKIISAQQLQTHDSVLSTTLWAFTKLLREYPKAFRPFVDQLYELILPLIACTPSTLLQKDVSSQPRVSSCPELVAHRARQLFVLLNMHPSKISSGQEWEKSLSVMIDRTQLTADIVFRGISEDSLPWIPSESIQRTPVSLLGICQSEEGDSDLLPWEGVSAGLERLDGRLKTVMSFLMLPTATPTGTPVSKIISLIDRILSILPPSSISAKQAATGTSTKPEIGRDEREAVWIWLPFLHTSALRIAEQLVLRLGEDSMSVGQQLLNQAMWILEHEHHRMEIREAVYSLLCRILPISASSLHRSVSSSISLCLRLCCNDLMPLDSSSGQGHRISSSSASQNDNSNADAYLTNSNNLSFAMIHPGSLEEKAASLLSMALTNLPSGFVSFALRSQVDRVAVLTRNELLLRSSVLNAPAPRGKSQQSSLLPLLSRQYPESHSTEALIRPRQPPLRPIQTNTSAESSDQEIDDREYRYGDIDLNTSDLHDIALRNLSPDVTEPNKGEEMTEGISSEAELASTHLQPPAIFMQQTLLPSPDAHLSMKRPRHSDPEETVAVTSNGSKHLLPPGGEPERKRMRESGQNIHVAPATEDDLPPPMALVPSDSFAPTSADLPASIEPLANLKKGNENLIGDESDDSSIAPIDPTWDTEDEQEEDVEDNLQDPRIFGALRLSEALLGILQPIDLLDDISAAYFLQVLPAHVKVTIDWGHASGHLIGPLEWLKALAKWVTLNLGIEIVNPVTAQRLDLPSLLS
ncbi:MAG: hypothetical protein Q9170_007741 [Blastenia crenularia]